MDRMQEHVSPNWNLGDYLKMIRKIQEEEQEEERNEYPHFKHKKTSQNEATTHLAVKEVVFWHAIYHLAQPVAWT